MELRRFKISKAPTLLVGWIGREINVYSAGKLDPGDDPHDFCVALNHTDEHPVYYDR